MFRSILLVIALAAIPPFPVSAGEDDGHEHGASAPAEHVVAERDEVAVLVKGLVCSFCAVGIDKRLEDVDAIDRERFSNGLLTNVENQLLRVALKPGAVVPFDEILRGVKRAGYEAVRFHVRAEGEVVAEGEGATLRAVHPPQRFALAGEHAAGSATFQLRIDAGELAGLAADGAVPAHVDERS